MWLDHASHPHTHTTRISALFTWYSWPVVHIYELHISLLISQLAINSLNVFNHYANLKTRNKGWHNSYDTSGIVTRLGLWWCSSLASVVCHWVVWHYIWQLFIWKLLVYVMFMNIKFMLNEVLGIYMGCMFLARLRFMLTSILSFFISSMQLLHHFQANWWLLFDCSNIRDPRANVTEFALLGQLAFLVGLLTKELGIESFRYCSTWDCGATVKGILYKVKGICQID